MFTSILVPLEAVEFGDPALPYALAMARHTGGSVEIVHVHRPFMPGAAFEVLPQARFQNISAADDVADAAAVREETGRLEELVRTMSRDWGVPVSARLLRGNPVEGVLEHQREAADDLIVTTVSGRMAPSHAWLGKTSDALLRQSPIPVLAIRPQCIRAASDAVQFRRILIPLDGTAFSESILPEATRLASLLGAEVELLHVAEPHGPDPFWARLRRPEPTPESAREYLERLAAGLDLPRERLRLTVIPHSNPAQAILGEANTGRFDLIVMASHGHGGIRPLLLGSTTETVLRSTHTPVLIYRPSAATGWDASRSDRRTEFAPASLP
jgi:nucleotide-binding universal stress UspA family protein